MLSSVERENQGAKPRGTSKAGPEQSTIAERHRDYKALERRHSGAARARHVAFVQCPEEAQGRRSVERLAAEQIIATENERQHMFDTAAKLEKEYEQRLSAEAEKRVVRATLADEEGLRRNEEARVAGLGEMHRLSLGTAYSYDTSFFLIFFLSHIPAQEVLLFSNS